MINITLKVNLIMCRELLLFTVSVQTSTLGRLRPESNSPLQIKTICTRSKSFDDKSLLRGI